MSGAKTVDGRGGCKRESKRFPIISSRAQTAERKRGHRGGVRARANININEARIPLLCVILYHVCPLLSAIRAQNLKWRSLSCASSVFISGAITGRTGSPIGQAGWSWSRCETPRRYLNISVQCHAFHPWRCRVATVCLQPVKMTSPSFSLSSGYTFNKSQNIIDCSGGPQGCHSAANRGLILKCQIGHLCEGTSLGAWMKYC